jgi:enoyl-CoA hydratase
MTSSCFEVDHIDRVAHVRMVRPNELNTMIPAFWRELPRVVTDLSDRGTVRAIVLSSTGRHFTAGMDLSVFDGDALGIDSSAREIGRVRANFRTNLQHLQDSFTALERARVPVLAAIQGGCIGGGVDMVSACDVRYATADAFFCIQEINIGITADVGTLQRLPKLIPEGVVREYAYTGRRMSAARAYELGFVNQIFADHDELIAGTLAIAAEIATKSPLAVWGTKEMINYARDHTVSDALNFIATWQSGMFQNADLGESMAARTEQRPPRYDDLEPVRRGLD